MILPALLLKLLLKLICWFSPSGWKLLEFGKPIDEKELHKTAWSLKPGFVQEHWVVGIQGGEALKTREPHSET